MSKILDFITTVRAADYYIEFIFTEGGCYQFYKILSSIFDGCVPYTNEKVNHVVTMYQGKLYDITGDVSGDEDEVYHEMTAEEIAKAEQWSFHKKAMLCLMECPYCEEPILYETKEELITNRGADAV